MDKLNFSFEYPEREDEENLDSFLLKSQTVQYLNQMKDEINHLIITVKSFEKLESVRRENRELKAIVDSLYKENLQLKDTIDLIASKSDFKE